MFIVELMCENHRELRWECVASAVSCAGRVTGSSPLRFNCEHQEECDCPVSALIWTPKGKRVWKVEHASLLHYGERHVRTEQERP